MPVLEVLRSDVGVDEGICEKSTGVNVGFVVDRSTCMSRGFSGVDGEVDIEEADPPTRQRVDVVQSIEDRENPLSFLCDAPKSLAVTLGAAMDQLLGPFIT